MGPNRIARRDWLLGTSASLVSLAAASGAASAFVQPGKASAAPQATSDAEDADRFRRMKWWHEARFGMFIHWGLYSAIGRHEWAMEDEGIPVAEYEQLAKTFQAQAERRARLGQAGQSRPAEVHGDDHQASRGILPLRYAS